MTGSKYHPRTILRGPARGQFRLHFGHLTSPRTPWRRPRRGVKEKYKSIQLVIFGLFGIPMQVVPLISTLLMCIQWYTPIPPAFPGLSGNFGRTLTGLSGSARVVQFTPPLIGGFHVSRPVKSSNPAQVARALTECERSRTKHVIHFSQRFDASPCPGCLKPVRYGTNGPGIPDPSGAIEVTIPFHSDPRKQRKKYLPAKDSTCESFLQVLESIVHGENPDYRARLILALQTLAQESR